MTTPMKHPTPPTPPAHPLENVAELTSAPLGRIELTTSPAPWARAWWTATRLIALTAVMIAAVTLLLGAAVSVPAALVLGAAAGWVAASYVPAHGQTMSETFGSSCSAVGGVLPTTCGLLTAAGGGTSSVLLGASLVGFGVLQRLRGPSACG